MVRVPLLLSVVELVGLSEGLPLGDAESDRLPALLDEGAPDADTDAQGVALLHGDALALTDGLVLGPIVRVRVLLLVMGRLVGPADRVEVRVKLELAVFAPLRVALTEPQRVPVGVTVSVVERVRDSELVAQLV